jgi:putative FmdB family regulatory protein
MKRCYNDTAALATTPNISGEVREPMPTYGYECTTCKNQLEVFQSIKDASLVLCEACGGTLRKLIYPVGISFKGSGFYVNDYASKAEKLAPDSGGTASEAKPETPKTESPKTETPKAETPKAEVKAAAAS